MNLFNDIHFPQDRDGDERRPHVSSYAYGYGNRVASAMAFAPLGRRREPRIRSDIAGIRNRGRALPCTAGACG